MQLFKLKVDLLKGQPMVEEGFDSSPSFEAPSRLTFRWKFKKGNFAFYLVGRSYSFAAVAELESWLTHFLPESAAQWATEIDGDLLIFVLDQVDHKAYLISDRNGANRAYYVNQSGTLSISNSIAELTTLMDSPRLCSFAAYQLLTMSYVLDPYCLIQDARTTMPGQIVAFRCSETNTASHYAPVSFDLDNFETEEECITALDEAYRRVFQKLLASSRVPCVLLSGGIDSLTILKYIKDACPGRVVTLTSSFRGLAPNELEPARIAARYFGTEHHEIVTDPGDLVDLYIKSLTTADTWNYSSLMSLGQKAQLEALGSPVEVFTGQDTRLHTPSFDLPRKIGILLSGRPHNALVLASAGLLSAVLKQYPLEGSLKNYLRYWADQLVPRKDLPTYVLEALASFHLPSGFNRGQHRHFARIIAQLPELSGEDRLETIHKKYVSFEYRTQYTDDMNNLVSSTETPQIALHCPFYDWETVRVANRIPFDLGSRRMFTLRSWNKMPFVNKAIARALVKGHVPEELLYRAKKTCPAAHVIFNSAVGELVGILLDKWVPDLLDGVDGEVRPIIEAYVAEYRQRQSFRRSDDEGLLWAVLAICYLAALNKLCGDRSVSLARELDALRSRHQASESDFRTLNYQ